MFVFMVSLPVVVSSLLVFSGALSETFWFEIAHIVVRSIACDQVGHHPSSFWATCQPDMMMAESREHTSLTDFANQRKTIGRRRSKSQPLFFAFRFQRGKEFPDFFAQKFKYRRSR